MITRRTTLFRFVAATMLAVCLAKPAFALTAGDVVDKMDSKQQHAYLWGAMEMTLYLVATQEKNNARAQCIANWYFEGGKASADAAAEILDVFHANKAKPAMALLQVVINRHCRAK